MNSEIYQQIRDEFLSKAKDSSGTIETAGYLSNGDDRIVAHFESSGKEHLLILSGEDEDEDDPIRAMPQILESIDTLENKPEISLVPFFDIVPSISELVGAEIERYSDLVSYLEKQENFESYGGDELQSMISYDNMEQKLYSIDDLESIQEIAVGGNVIGIQDDEDLYRLEEKVESFIDIASPSLPEKFYVSYFNQDDEKDTKAFFNEPLIFEGEPVLHFRRTYTSFTDSGEPEELHELAEIAHQCDYALNFHQNGSDDGFFISYRMPDSLLDQLAKTARQEGVELESKPEIEDYLDVSWIDNGIAELNPTETTTADLVQEGYIVCELPSGTGYEDAATSIATEFTKYFSQTNK